MLLLVGFDLSRFWTAGPMTVSELTRLPSALLSSLSWGLSRLGFGSLGLRFGVHSDGPHEPKQLPSDGDGDHVVGGSTIFSMPPAPRATSARRTASTTCSDGGRAMQHRAAGGNAFTAEPRPEKLPLHDSPASLSGRGSYRRNPAGSNLEEASSHARTLRA
jgi:hypothetical protein